MVILVALTLGHVFMVFAVDPYSLRSIVTGGYNDSRSPEQRNARPFLNLRAARAPAVAPAPVPAEAPAAAPPPPSPPSEKPPGAAPPGAKEPEGKA